MKFVQIMIPAMLTLSTVVGAPVLADDAAAPAAVAYSTTSTDIGTLLDTPVTRAVLDKHIADFASNPQIDMARAMTLRQIQAFAGDMLSDDVLNAIDADLAVLPAAN